MAPSFQLSQLDAVEWLRSFNAASVDLVLTDPPYESQEKPFLEDDGDVPQQALYSFIVSHNADEGDAITTAVMEMRESHFARLSKPVPPYSERLR